MNATSLYVSTCRLVLQANAEDSVTWTDLFRLVPFLRQSLSCTVCGSLLIEPHSPTETNCQHHVCKSCKGGKKKLKPSCSWCKDYEKYVENVQLRILLQCYKKLCCYITSTSIFKKLGSMSPPSSSTNTNLLDGTTPTLISLIQEGAGFADEFHSTASERPSTCISPCVYTNSTSTQTTTASTSVLQGEDRSTPVTTLSSPVKPTENDNKQSEDKTTESVKEMSLQEPPQNGSTPTYSVVQTGIGKKLGLTFKRKATESVSTPGSSQDTSGRSQRSAHSPSKSHPVQVNKIIATPVKKPARGGKSSLGGGVKSGCRCGNATATPGKLTCCGQRCACYTESKPCIDCKCRGCRNPHTADGQKICPVLTNYQVQLMSDDGRHVTGPQCVTLSSNEIATASGGTVQVVGMYTTQLHTISSTPVLLDANTQVTTCGVSSEDAVSDLDVDA